MFSFLFSSYLRVEIGVMQFNIFRESTFFTPPNSEMFKKGNENKVLAFLFSLSLHWLSAHLLWLTGQDPSENEKPLLLIMLEQQA